MLGKDFFALIEKGLRPTIQINQLADNLDIYANVGMKAVVEGVYKEEKFNNEQVFVLQVDFKPYEEENKKVAKLGFYDQLGRPILTWFESNSYKDGKDELWFGSEKPVYFDIVEDNNSI